MSLAQGTLLGPYRVEALIGAGGMGEVYRARDGRLNRDVAIKILSAGFASNPERLRRFEREAEAIGRLNHPNVLTIYDVGLEGETPFLVSELLSGEPLSADPALAARRGLPVGRAIDYVIQAASGLAAAHAAGVVHRDLKPQNLFVTRDGHVKLLDFGLAKLDVRTDATPKPDEAVTKTMLTEAGSVYGTPAYMSPEQVRGEGADERSDLFALGAILFELLTGRRPFDGRSSGDLVSAILRDDPPALGPDVPEIVGRIIRRCLEKDPALRFQSAQDLQFALREAAGIASPRRSARKWWPLVAGGAVVAGLAGALFVWNHASDRGPAVASVAVMPFRNLSTNQDDTYFADEMTAAVGRELSHLSRVRVVSNTSAMAEKSAPTKAADIARRLDVDEMLEGSVGRANGRVTVTATLVEGVSGKTLWSRTFDRDVSEVLALERELAGAVAVELKAPMATAADTDAQPRKVNPDANEAYLRGRYALRQTSEAAIAKAIDLFNQAIVADPGDARPHAGLADAYTMLRSVYRPPRQVMPQAKAAAATALQIDRLLAEAHVAMGGVLMFYDYKWVEAEAELHRAITLSPSLASAHDYYGQLLGALGRRDEAASELTIARHLDPLSLQVLNDAGWAAYLARDYDTLIALNQQALDIDPGYWPALRDIGVGYEKLGRFDEGIAALEKARAIDANSSVLEMLGGVYAAAGKRDKARAVLDELIRTAGEHYVCPYEVATVHAGLGDKRETMAWLERGLKDRADCMPWTRFDPKLDDLRDTPQFQDLLKRMGFPK